MTHIDHREAGRASAPAGEDGGRVPSRRPDGPEQARRRFLGLLGGLGAASLVPALLPRRRVPRELALKQADFYRPHDLAG